MFSIKWKEKGACGKLEWSYAVHATGPNKGRKCKFKKRSQAKAWLHNHRWEWCGATRLVIMHDGKEEVIEGVDLERMQGQALHGRLGGLN
jgi:hypothetical protein